MIKQGASWLFILVFSMLGAFVADKYWPTTLDASRDYTPGVIAWRYIPSRGAWTRSRSYYAPPVAVWTNQAGEIDIFEYRLLEKPFFELQWVGHLR